jgi:hypothetical protein
VKKLIVRHKNPRKNIQSQSRIQAFVLKAEKLSSTSGWHVQVGSWQGECGGMRLLNGKSLKVTPNIHNHAGDTMLFSAAHLPDGLKRKDLCDLNIKEAMRWREHDLVAEHAYAEESDSPHY